MRHRSQRPIPGPAARAMALALVAGIAACGGEPPRPAGGEIPDSGVAVPPVTPFARPPRLLNYDSAVSDLRDAYAPGPDATGGRVLFWIQVDTLGRIVEFRFPRSGRFPAVEEAAGRLAPRLRFEPARSGSGAPVPSWVQLPIDVRPGATGVVTLDTAAWLIPRFTPIAASLRPVDPARAESLFAEWVAPVARGGASGTVSVDLWVDTAGAVRVAQLAQSSGHPELDQAVKRWAGAITFTPPIDTAGRPTEAWVNLPIRIGAGTPR